MQRLDKILSEAGVGSRKELKSLIRAGRVTVDGAVVREEAKKFDEAACTIAVDGAAVEKYRKVLLMLHKPAGYVILDGRSARPDGDGADPGAIPEVRRDAGGAA